MTLLSAMALLCNPGFWAENLPNEGQLELMSFLRWKEEVKNIKRLREFLAKTHVQNQKSRCKAEGCVRQQPSGGVYEDLQWEPPQRKKKTLQSPRQVRRAKKGAKQPSSERDQRSIEEKPATRSASALSAKKTDVCRTHGSMCKGTLGGKQSSVKPTMLLDLPCCQLVWLLCVLWFLEAQASQ